MSGLHKRNEWMLDMLESLARSQKALSRIIENIADVSSESPNLSKQLAGNMQVISRYQRAFLEKLTGIRITRVGSSGVKRPWVNRQIKVCSGGTSDEAAQDKGGAKKTACGHREQTGTAFDA